MTATKWTTFLKDVFLCALGSYGGPEAHYGVFSQILAQKKGYITEEELSEMIGLFALVPGPASTQTITAIGYKVGGPMLALLTFLVWALPAIFIMSLFGVFFNTAQENSLFSRITTFFPAIAVAFIIYAGLNLSKKVLKNTQDWLLFLLMLILALFLVKYSVWMVPVLLMMGGLSSLIPNWKKAGKTPLQVKPRWFVLALVILLAIGNEVLLKQSLGLTFTLFAAFYRYGYSVIGGGQILIPLMIQDLVNSQSLLSLKDFLSGFAIDQAIPGPLFSFASFVSARSTPGQVPALLNGIIGGLAIFLPGLLLVYFIFPLWQSSRKLPHVKVFLKGVSITAASLIVMTALTQLLALPKDPKIYVALTLSTLLLLSKKIPAPFIVFLGALAGYVLS